MKLSEELTWRGFVNQTTFTDVAELDDEPRTFYLGVDPSAPSMHIGNLAQVMVVKHLIAHGHKAIVLVGGATGMIGDPKQDSERDLKTLDEIARNKDGIAMQYRQLLEGEVFELVDNYDWFRDIGYLNFLREIGKHFSMTQLLDRDFVQSRIGEGGVGISYAEFSYSLIQGYDFLHLYRTYGATLQIGGSDQWGNMLSGAQMIKKLEGGEAHVWTVPLVIDTSTGKKFGKSEGNAIWLDPQLTSPYQFYQFWLNTDDKMAEDLIKIFTLLDRDTVSSVIETHHTNPGARTLQKTIAREVTSLVHSKEACHAVERVNDVLFGSHAFSSLSNEDVDALASEIPTVELKDAVMVSDILRTAGVVASKGEARRLEQSGAVTIIGGEHENLKLENDIFINKVPTLIKKGKNTFILVR